MNTVPSYSTYIKLLKTTPAFATLSAKDKQERYRAFVTRKTK